MFEGLSAGSQAVEQLNKQLDVDKFEELKDKIEDQMADVAERQEFFVNAGAQDDDEELLDELDELEAEMAAEDFGEVEVSSGAIAGAYKPQAARPQANQEIDEAEELARMMAAWSARAGWLRTYLVLILQLFYKR